MKTDDNLVERIVKKIKNQYQDWESLSVEMMWVVIVDSIDSENRIIWIVDFSNDEINKVQLTPREFIKSVLIRGGEKVVLVHNHVQNDELSGNPCPSEQDIQITNQLAEAGKHVGIEILDHIIIGAHDYYSFVENHIAI